MLKQYKNQSCFYLTATVRKRNFKNTIYNTIKSCQMPRNKSNKSYARPLYRKLHT